MGLTFTSPHTSSATTTRAGNADRADANAVTVLLVEDDPLMLGFLRLSLARTGWNCMTAQTGAEACEILAADPSITVIVSDIQMPTESGLDLANWLATNSHDDRHAELILITGDTNNEALIAALRSRVFDFLHKPFEVRSLIEAVDRADRAARARRERFQRLSALDGALSTVRAEREVFQSRLHQAEARFADTSARLAYVNQTMAHIVSHELRTPLIPIIGLAELLETTENLGPDEVREHAAEIRAAGENLAAIVENALSFIDIERQVRALPHDLVDMSQLADEVIAELATQVSAKSVTITKVSAPGTTARAPRWLLRRAMHALCDNAVKASPRGGVVILAQRAGDGGGVVVDLRDKGPGLPERVRRNFGAPFLNGDNSDTRTWPGIGLGIASALRVVEGLGGSLTIQQVSAGTGTHLRLHLPS